MKNRILQAIKNVETLPRSIWHFVGIFYIFVIIRNLLELALEKPQTLDIPLRALESFETIFLHFPLFYFFLLLLIGFTLRFFVKENLKKILKILFLFSFVIIVVPLVDIVFNPSGFDLSYPGSIRVLPQLVIRVFNPLLWTQPFTVASPGMIVEIYIGFLLVLIYIWVKSGNLLKGVIGGILIGIEAGFVGFLPYLISKILTFGAPGSFVRIFNEGGLIITSARRYAFIFLLLSGGVLLFSYIFFKKDFPKVKWSRFFSWQGIFLAILSLFGFLMAWAVFKDTFPFIFKNPLDFLVMPAIFLSSLLFVYAKNEEKSVYKIGFIGVSLLLFFCISYTAFFLFLIVVGMFLISKFSLKMLQKYPGNILMWSIGGVFSFYAGFSILGLGRTLKIVPFGIAFNLFILIFISMSLLHYLNQNKRINTIILTLLLLLFSLSPLLFKGTWLIFISCGISILIFLFHFFRLQKRFIIYLFTAFYIGSLLLFFFTKSIDNQFIKGVSYLWKGDYYFKTLKYKKATLEYLDALSWKVKDIYVVYNLANSLLKQDNFLGAATYLEGVTKYPYLSPIPYAYLTYGFSLLKAKLGFEKKGEEVYNKAISFLYYPAECFHQLGVEYKMKSEFGKALRCFKNAYKLGYNRGDCLRQIGEIWWILRKPFEIIEKIFKASLKEERKKEVALRLAYFYYLKGRWDEALNIYMEWEKESPKDPIIKNNIGLIYGKKGFLKKAALYILSAIEIDPKFKDAYINLAEVFTLAGYPEKAEFVLKKGIEANPEDKIIFEEKLREIKKMEMEK